MFDIILILFFSVVTVSAVAYVAFCERRENQSVARRKQHIREKFEAMPDWAKREYIDNFAESVRRHIDEADN